MILVLAVILRKICIVLMVAAVDIVYGELDGRTLPTIMSSTYSLCNTCTPDRYQVPCTGVDYHQALGLTI